MQLTINNKKYDIYFGIDAINFIDKAYPIESEESGIVFNANTILGQGMNLFVSALQAYNPVAVANLIKAGTSTSRSKPSNIDIDMYIADLINEDKIEDFCKDVLDFLKQQPLTKKRVAQILQIKEEAEEKESKTQKTK